MTEWQIVLLTSLVSVVASILTTKVTSWFGHQNDVKRWILERRAELYFTFYEHVELLLRDPGQAFDDSYFSEVQKYKPKMKLLSSKKTFNSFKSYFEFLRDQNHKIKQFHRENDPSWDLERYHTEYDENGDEQEVPDFSHFEIKEFERSLELFKQNNRPHSETICQLIEPLYQAMRDDLGSNL